MNNGNREHVSVCKSAPPPQCRLHTQTLSVAPLLCLWQLPCTLILVDDGIVWISCQSLVVTAMSSSPPHPELSLALLFCFSTDVCGCSVAPTIRVSLQPNVQQWHLAEPPPHPNFLSPSLCCSQSIIANVQPCINYSVVSVSVSVCLSICVEEHIPKTLPLLLCLCPCYLPLCVT